MRRPFSFIFGSILILFGLVFLLDNFGYVDSDWIFENFWPLAFIILGVAFLARRSRWQVQGNQPGASMQPGTLDSPVMTDHLSESAIFGNISRQIASKSFTGGDCSVVLGDIRIDLTQIELLSGTQTIRFSTVLGNMQILLPLGLEYSVMAHYVAGGMSIKGEKRGGLFQKATFQTVGFAAAEKRLAIHISSVLGDTSID